MTKLQASTWLSCALCAPDHQTAKTIWGQPYPPNWHLMTPGPFDNAPFPGTRNRSVDAILSVIEWLYCLLNGHRSNCMRPAETIRYDMVQKSMTARLSRQRRLQTQGRIRRMIVDGQHCYCKCKSATATARGGFYRLRLHRRDRPCPVSVEHLPSFQSPQNYHRGHLSPSLTLTLAKWK